MNPLSVQAALGGLLSGAVLFVGAAVGHFAALPTSTMATIMALGRGVLI